MKCFIRSPAWVTAGFASKYAGPNGANVNCRANQCALLAMPEETNDKGNRHRRAEE
jgi:hypothetical protein